MRCPRCSVPIRCETIAQVFELLSEMLPGFDFHNWTSTLRTQAGFEEFTGEEITDFEYDDTEGVLAQSLFPDRMVTDGTHLKFFIEVKATSGSNEEPFQLSCRQLDHVRGFIVMKR